MSSAGGDCHLSNRMVTVPNQTKTIKNVLEDGTRFLAAKGSERARLPTLTANEASRQARQEAEKLIAFGLGKSRIDVYLSLDKPLTQTELGYLRQYFKDRASGKPLQYITGEVYFRYLKLKVNKDTFIPRPETETIVDLALSILCHPDPAGAGEGSPVNSSVLELGTGSGVIALALAQEGKVKVDALDISEKALEIAKENAQMNKIEGIKWIKSDWFDKVSKKYDLIVCNPPYVSLEEYNDLPVEIKEHEPNQAVTDNGDGLKCLKEIISAAPKYLNEKGSLLLEIGFDQKEEVKKLLEKAGFDQIAFEKDLANHTRFAIASV